MATLRGMSQGTRRILVGLIILIVAGYFVVPLFRYSEGEAGTLYTCYVTGDQKQADDFFEKLQAVIKAQGFQSGSLVDSGLPQMSSPEGETYHGSYQGSRPFTIGLIREGPNRNNFQISYVWNFHAFSPSRDRMNQSTEAFSAFLRHWAESHGAGDIFVRK